MKAPSTQTAFRLGSAALGLLVGLPLGLAAALAKMAFLQADPSFPALIFGFGGVGALIGLAYPSAAWTLVEGTIHFFLGLVGVAANEYFTPNHDAPLWLKVLLWLGVATGLLLAVMF